MLYVVFQWLREHTREVRYRGLKKNTHRLLVSCALANLFIG